MFMQDNAEPKRTAPQLKFQVETANCGGICEDKK